MANWETTAEILFESNGSEVMDALIESAELLTKTLETATEAAATAVVMFENLEKAAIEAGSALELFNEAAELSAESAEGAATAVGNASRRYARLATNAAKATKAVNDSTVALKGAGLVVGPTVIGGKGAGTGGHGSDGFYRPQNEMYTTANRYWRKKMSDAADTGGRPHDEMYKTADRYWRKQMAISANEDELNQRLNLRSQASLARQKSIALLKQAEQAERDAIALDKDQKSAEASLARQKSKALYEQALQEMRDAEKIEREKNRSMASLARQQSRELYAEAKRAEREAIALEKAKNASMASLARQRSRALYAEALAAEREANEAGSGGLLGFAGGLMKNVLRRTLEGAIIGGAASSFDALYEGSKLGLINTSIANITGADGPKMDSLERQEFVVGRTTAMTPIQSAEMFRDIARMTYGTMQFKDMQSMFPTLAKMQVVLGATRGFSVKQTDDAILSMVHLFRVFGAAEFPKLANKILMMGEISPTNLSQASKQFGYMAGVLHDAKVPIEDQMAMYVAAARAGFGAGRAGTNIADLVNAAIGPMLSLTKADNPHLIALGPKYLNVLDAGGKSRFFNGKTGNILGFFEALSDRYKAVGSQEFRRETQKGFGVQGGRIADMMSDPVIMSQLETYIKILGDKKNKSLNTDNQAKTIMATAQKQIEQAWADFQAMMTEIGKHMSPTLARLGKDLGDSFNAVTDWIQSHPKVTRAAEQFLMGLVGIEKFVVKNKFAFQEAGDLLLSIGKFVVALTPPLAAVLNILMPLGGAISFVAARLLDFSTAIIKFLDKIRIWIADHLGITWIGGKLQDYLNSNKLSDAINPHFGGAYEHNPNRKQTGSVTVHQTFGNISFHLPKGTTGKEIQLLLSELGNPQSTLHVSGPNNTTSRLPSVLSVGLGYGG